MTSALFVLAAYLIGSVSFAVVVGWFFGLPDPHSYGSGNPGATNVLRTGKKAAAVLTLVRGADPDSQTRADIAASFQQAIVEVLVAKSVSALAREGLDQLVVAGGVGANQALRQAMSKKAERGGFEVFYPPQDLCTDNGAMIAFAGALRLAAGAPAGNGFKVRARWDLEELTIASA